VIATVREWREHEASLLQLRQIESDVRREKGASAAKQRPPELAPPLEWWSENFALVRDIAIRRYPVHIQTYDGLLADPEGVIGSVLGWLGRGDFRTACDQVRAERRTFRRPESRTLEPAVAAVFDELYAAFENGAPLSPSFLQKLNDTNDALRPLFAEHRERLRRHVADGGEGSVPREG
jgi:hypothetical protein